MRGTVDKPDPFKGFAKWFAWHGFYTILLLIKFHSTTPINTCLQIRTDVICGLVVITL